MCGLHGIQYISVDIQKKHGFVGLSVNGLIVKMQKDIGNTGNGFLGGNKNYNQFLSPWIRYGTMKKEKRYES